jgi:hypothetical protein
LSFPGTPRRLTRKCKCSHSEQDEKQIKCVRTSENSNRIPQEKQTSRVFKNTESRASAIVHTCNPCYSGCGDQKGCSSKLTWAKSKTPGSTNKLGMVAYAYGLSYMECIGRRIVI